MVCQQDSFCCASFTTVVKILVLGILTTHSGNISFVSLPSALGAIRRPIYRMKTAVLETTWPRSDARFWFWITGLHGS